MTIGKDIFYCMKCGSVVDDIFTDPDKKTARASADGRCIYCSSDLELLGDKEFYEKEAASIGRTLIREDSSIYLFCGDIYELVRQIFIYPSPVFDKELSDWREKLEELDFQREIIIKDYIHEHKQETKASAMYCPKCGNIVTTGYDTQAARETPNGRLDENGKCIFCHNDVHEFGDYVQFVFSSLSEDELWDESEWVAPFTAPEYEAIRKKYVYPSADFNILLFEKRERIDTELLENNTNSKQKNLKAKIGKFKFSLPSNKIFEIFSQEAEKKKMTVYEYLGTPDDTVCPECGSSDISKASSKIIAGSQAFLDGFKCGACGKEW